MIPTFYTGYISSTQNPEQQYEVARPCVNGTTQVSCVRETCAPMTASEAEGYLREACVPWMPARIVRLADTGRPSKTWMWGVWIVGPDTDMLLAREPSENRLVEVRRAQNYAQDMLLSDEVA